jgi:hypothetical protein
MAFDELHRELLSRPIRLAAELRDEAAAAVASLFAEARIMIRLEDAFGNLHDARETFLFAVNQTLRFCPNVALCVPADARDLVQAADELAVRIHGPGHHVRRMEFGDATAFSAIMNVGTELEPGLPWTTVNSTGWVARVATSVGSRGRLPWVSSLPNPVGALAAGCLGVGRLFLQLVGRPLEGSAFELSLFTHEASQPGSLQWGPSLPQRPVDLDGFLVGCGAVSNGWAYAVRRLPIRGHLEAIDRQALRIENIGPYVLTGREHVGSAKAEVIKTALAPAVAVTPRADEWEFFKIRLRHGLHVPPLIVGGLDNVETRHSVQRLWPEILIDMAAGGLTSQLIVKQRGTDGICLLRALRRPGGEVGWAEQRARETGLRVDRILEQPTTQVTSADVDAAPPDKREMLEHARQQGQLVCGRVTEQNLRFEPRDQNFSPAVPFVTSFAGVVGAAATMKYLMGYRDDSGHYQQSFQSGRGRWLSLKCDPDCECRRVQDEPASARN